MKIRIALAGNPNCGKTTLFNALTGSNQYVGNWPGVTVEKKEGKLINHKEITITDLPGVYSLSPYTLEEVVTRNYLIHEKPDVIINLIDASNLERNLYLTTQIIELGVPVVVALNMIDIVQKKGDLIDSEKLAAELKCVVVEMSALKEIGSSEAVEKAIELVHQNVSLKTNLCYDQEVEAALSSIASIIQNHVPESVLHWYAIKVFERDQNVLVELKLDSEIASQLEAIISSAEVKLDEDSESIITNERYRYIDQLTRMCITKNESMETTSDKIDKIVTNRWLAFPIFALAMYLVYSLAVSRVGGAATKWANETFFAEIIKPAVSGLLESAHAASWLSSLIVDGIIGGVGAVLGFVPQLFVLFFFLSILEDCGYMSRVAFIMDRIFHTIGLSGKSFIPMLISSGCGVPGVMASRTIENESERRMTIMTTTFIPCGAKLPVIALIGGAMFPHITWMAPAMYFMGILTIIFSGIVLKKTKLFFGEHSPFLMELPPYHIPSLKSVLIHAWERIRSFVIKAGTVIFAACAVIWFLSNFGFTGYGFAMVETQYSLLAKIGSFIAPVFAPLGFGDWRAAVATISGFIAKENLVSTFGVLLSTGDDAGAGGLLKQIALVLPHASAAASFLIFNLLCAPCVAAMAAIAREMASARWTVLALGYQTTLAYMVSLIVYQLGGLLAGDKPFGLGTAAAILTAMFMFFLLIRPSKSLSKD